jgi:gluconolactonase
MNWKFELLAGPFGAVSEGPAWDGRFLYFSLIQKGVVMRYDPKTEQCIEWRSVPQWTNGLMFDAAGRLHGCCVRGRSIVRFEPNGEITTLVSHIDGKRLNTPNDLAIERSGRIWFSDPWNDTLLEDGVKAELKHRSIVRVDLNADRTWSAVSANFDTNKPNGVLLSKDEKTLYVSQCDHGVGVDQIRELRAYPIREDGSLDRYIVLHKFGEDYRGMHRPIDGMCLDADGNIVATAGWRESGPGPLIYVFSPEGRVLETHPVPSGHPPTNCTFGDADLHTLYVTTKGGHLFGARTDRAGWNIYP